ncbi:MAG: minichromosome maintenance protein MCM [Thermoplasmata archaeon]|nr:minichromosome maintenance protein MCM [Thermoplasmata archaeon]
MVEQTQESLVQKWGEILEEYDYVQKIKTISDNYPDKRSLKVLYDDIDHYDSDLASLLLTSPEKVISAGEDAIKEYIPPTEEGVKISLRISDIPKDLRTEVRKIRSKHLGNFLSVEGIVKRASEVRPRVHKAVFECGRCGTNIIIYQDDAILHEPMECPKEEGGCGRARGSTRFKPLISKSSFIDTQNVEIQERPEKLRGGALAQFLTAMIEEDQTGYVYPGDRIIINGILKTRMMRKSGNQMTLFDIYLEVNSIDRMDPDLEEIEVSEEDQQKIDELAADPDIYSKMVQSISPTIYGLNIEKEALVLQLFGGVGKTMEDGTKIRGDIHILLVGDPGTAKSQLLSQMANITPRGIYASGKSSTSAGLTAAAVKDESGDGRWTLEAGALVLADKGLACVDELDKMSKQDSSSMHEAMEQQTISVAKAGITATLQARCSVLGAANPKEGRFDRDEYLFGQINMPPTLLSRFDLIFPFMDKPNTKEDTKIATHILRSHLLGEMIMKMKDAESDMEIPEDFKDMLENLKPAINPELLRKYVYIAKKIYPVLSDEAIEALKKYYLEVRKLGEGEGKAIPITARQLEAFVRLSEASARGRMSSEVTADDAERAIKVSKEFFRRVLGRGEYEGWDTDIVSTGKPKEQRDKMKMIKDMVTDLMRHDSEGFIEDDFVKAANDVLQMLDSEAKRYFDKMKSDGLIYQTTTAGGKDIYKPTREL